MAGSSSVASPAIGHSYEVPSFVNHTVRSSTNARIFGPASNDIGMIAGAATLCPVARSTTTGSWSRTPTSRVPLGDNAS
jgi:hypothetical protein